MYYHCIAANIAAATTIIAANIVAKAANAIIAANIVAAGTAIIASNRSL